MADAALVFLRNSLKELLIQDLRLITDARGEIEDLERQFLVFNAFLKDSVEKRRDGDVRTKAMVQEIREVVYDVEDIIETLVNKTVAEKNGSTGLVKKLFKTPLDLRAIGQQVADVRKRVEQARTNIGLVGLEEEQKSQQSQADVMLHVNSTVGNRPPTKKEVVGFEDEAQDLIHRLIRDSQYMDVISLTGMLGQGKTTLARKVYNDPDIIDKFPVRIWLSISQEFSDRDIYLSILKELRTTITEDILHKKEEELADLVIYLLGIGSFLIVMDDVNEITLWRKLSLALPYHNSKGKVLITSLNEKLGKFASRPYPIKKLRLFTDEESWRLLQLEALHTLDCPLYLESVGKVIAKNCQGMPLAIVMIGGILATKSGVSHMGETIKQWDTISTVLSTYYKESDPEKIMEKLICLNYYMLPGHLRSCFLYLGMFPKNFEIRVSKLIRMWIGEGLIQQGETGSLEEAGEKYLEELINSDLVKIEKFKHDGKVKTCRIPDTLRDFCQTEAANENLVKEIKYVGENFTPPISEINNYRRLAIHSNCLGFISSKPSCPRARSFVCFSKDKFVVSEQNSAKVFAAFKFLRVLDVEPFKFDKVDTDIYQLVYMRYLVLSSTLSILPTKLNQLWNLQTLIIDTTSRTLQVKADIWKMNKLRYFKTNAAAILPKPRKSSEHGKQLHTLGTISEESCTPELFNQASNLKKLGIRGYLSLFFDGSSGSFDSLGKMEYIEKLKLINDVYPYPSSEKPLHALPQHHQFPSRLMSLTLRATFFSWDAMSTLGLLKKLEVLKLKENAFMGATWNLNADDGGFECLQLLHIEDTDLIIWNASSRHYPKLKSLVLRNCEKLLEIPECMADIPSLQTLELYTCMSAAPSAKKISEAKKGSAFVLSIYPPIA